MAFKEASLMIRPGSEGLRVFWKTCAPEFCKTRGSKLPVLVPAVLRLGRLGSFPCIEEPTRGFP